MSNSPEAEDITANRLIEPRQSEIKQLLLDSESAAADFHGIVNVLL